MIRQWDKKLSLHVIWLMCVGKEVTVTHQYAAVGLLAFPLFWIAGAGSAVFWVIGEIFLPI